jgi:endonuclease YncB( thermonuclease family)
MRRRWQAGSAGRVRRFPATLGLGVVLLIVLMANPSWRMVDAQGQPVCAVDGDTLRLGQRSARLIGIDAVELAQPCQRADGARWRCGAAARDALAALVARGDLQCRSRGTDRYGRLLVRCAVAGTPDIGAVLVAQGWAVSGDGRDDGPYAAGQAAARAAGRGIWQGSFTRPAQWRAEHGAPAAP